MTVKDFESFRIQDTIEYDLKFRFDMLNRCEQSETVREAKTHLLCLQDKRNDLYQEAQDFIQQLPKSWQPVIQYRYLDGLSWADIERETGYSWNRARMIGTEVMQYLKTGKRKNWHM